MFSPDFFFLRCWWGFDLKMITSKHERRSPNRYENSSSLLKRSLPYNKYTKKIDYTINICRHIRISLSIRLLLFSREKLTIKLLITNMNKFYNSSILYLYRTNVFLIPTFYSRRERLNRRENNWRTKCTYSLFLVLLNFSLFIGY